MPTVQTEILYRDQFTISEYESERCRLDLYLPDAESAPVLLWFHGGGLTEGDKGGYVHMAQYLVAAGIGVALANYRFSPVVKYPAYVGDARAALDWLHRNLGGRKLFVGGHSAGAYLAALMALQPMEVPNPPIAGVIPMSGQTVTHFTVRAERGLEPNQIVADEAAPIYHISPTAPPFCVLISDNDIPGRLEENQYFVAMMRAVGHKDTEFHVVAERDHGSIAEQFGEMGDRVAEVVLDFIRKYS